jgi:voltage-gated potassium channel
LSPTNQVLACLIVLSVGLAVLETEPTLSHLTNDLRLLELGLGVVFAVEYLARLWAAPEGADGSARARLRFAFSPAGLADLTAVVSAFLPMAAPGLLLRMVRLLRLFRLAKLGRMSRAWSDIATAINDRREALALSFGLALVAILIAATALYLVEGQVQPEAFGSIPRSAWWAVATLTTIGYGDAYPVTAPGRLIGGVAALASIGLVALPAGILAAAFSDAMKRNRGSNSLPPE